MNKEVFLLILTAAIAFLPNLQAGIISGHDSVYHLARIQTLYEALQEGIFPVKVHPSFVGYGYGTGFFYPNHFLYLPAGLMLAGASLEVSYKVFLLVILIAMALIMYDACMALSRRRKIAFLAAILYLFSNRTFYNIYERFALGEVLAMVFMPLAVSGVYLFFVKDAHPARMMLGMTGLLLTHTITTVLTAAACILMVILCVRIIRDIPGKLWKTMLAAACVLLICASYWLPMWQQMRAMRLRAAAPWAVSSDYIVPLTTAAGAEGYGGAVLILTGVAVVRLFQRMHAAGRMRFVNVQGGMLLSIGIILTFLTSLRPFFVLMNQMGIRLIQFPTRIYGVAIVFLLMGSGMVLSAEETVVPKRIRFVTNGRYGVLWIAVLAGVAFFTFRSSFVIWRDTALAVMQHSEDTLGGSEWLPLQTETEMLKTPEVAYDDAGHSVQGIKEHGYSTFRFTDTGSSVYVVPFIYYRGYEARTEDGTAWFTRQDEETGLLKIERPEDARPGEEIIVRYAGTGILRLSYCMSVVGVICFALMLLWNKNGSIIISLCGLNRTKTRT